MKWMKGLCGLILSTGLAACGGGANGDADNAAAPDTAQESQSAGAGESAAQSPAGAEATETPEATGTAEATEIAPGGLSMRVLNEGSGETAAPGQTAVVHYTGWLYDENAPDHRGKKFDSSVDRGTPFEFPLGAGDVISGWDQGVVGMQIGEVRELTVAPELAYGDRGAGDVIPPGATLVFEVELLDLR